MWLLISERGELFLITPKIEHLVSRKGGSITLSDDQSISRQHAKILLENEDQNDDSGIVLVDMSSKYGTFINSGIESNTKIETNQRIILKHDDLVRFGLQWNIWRVVFMPIIILTSTLNHQEKAEIKSNIEKIGGKLISNWSPVCSHLTMNQITLTVKVVSALGAGQHIVTPQYWQNLIKAIELKKGKLPDPVAFIPPLNEETLNQNNVSFLVNKQRSSLFKSLLFIAVSFKQKRRIEPMVTSAGGSVVEFSECNLSKDDMCREGVIVMQSLPSPGNGSQVPESYLGVVKYLTSKGLRCIPESDIGLSIVYCSCEKFCNPKHKLQSLFQHHTTPREQTQSSAILVQNTQENSLAVAGTSDVGKIINETCTGGIFTASSTKNSKRLGDENNKSNVEESPQFKKPSKISSYFKIKDTLVSNTFSNSDNEISVNNSQADHSVKKDDKIKSLKKNDVHVDDDSDDKFSFVNEKEQISVPSNSVDIFNTSSKSSSKTVTNYNATSVDIFGTNIKSSDLPKQNDAGSKSTVFSSSIASVKQSYSIFQVSAKKNCVNDDDDSDNDDFKFKKNDDNDDDFKFQNSKNNSNASLNDNIFGTSDYNELKRKMPIDDPFQSNKTDCNKRLKTKDDLSYSRGMKRNMSVEEIQAKRPAINVIDIDSDDNDDDDDDSSKNKNIIPEHVTNANNLESIVIKKEIKQEEAFEEGYIRDEELHDSTVVIVKSLIVPLRNISLSSSRSDIMNKSSSVNFKKFRKATPLKTPDFIELIPYKESTDCWTEKAAAIYVSDSSSEDDNWEFQQNRATSQKKIRSGK